MFGANKPTTPSFGGFGATTTTPAFGTTPATTSAVGFQFGATQPATGFQFGTPATSAAPGFSGGSLTLGSNMPAAGTSNFSGGGVSFGTPTTAASSNFSGGGIVFGSPATTSAAGLTFGAPAPTAATGLNIGGTTSTPSLFGTPSLSFGATTSAATGLSFGAPQTTPTVGFSFGQPAATTAVAPSTGFSLGPAKTTGGLTLGATSTPSFSFASTSTPTLGTTLGLPPSSTPAAGFTLGGGLLGSSIPATGLSTGLSTTPSVGLGGLDSSQAKLGLSGAGVTEPKQVKDNQLPDPILQTFTDFQAFVKQQKSLSADIAHSSSKPLKKVQENIDSIESLLASVTSGLARNSVATEKLKGETAQALFHADMAQRMREAPSALGYERDPEQYFIELVTRFETDAERLQVQVEAAGRHLRSITQSSALSPQELTLAMKRLHDTLVVLAARVQSLHSAKLSVEEDYRHLRHVYLKEDLPITVKSAATNRRPAQRSLAGPTPFSETSGTATLSVDALSMLTGAASPLAPATSAPGWLGSQAPSNTLMASPTSSFLSPLPADNGGFQLSKPPVGSKRNKR